MEYVFALFKSEEHEGESLEGLFASKVSALKQGLKIKRDSVQQYLNDYRELGCDSAEYCYLHGWDHTRMIVRKMLIN